MRDFHPLRDAAHAPDVRLDDVRAALRDQFLEAVLRVLVLAGRDRDVDGARDRGETSNVVGQHRLLEPVDVVLSKRRAMPIACLA